MRNSRIVAVLAAATAVAAGAMAIPAGATTAPIPTRPTALQTSPYVLNTLMANGVVLGANGAAALSVSGYSQAASLANAFKPVAIPVLTFTFPSTRTSATGLSHTGSVTFRRGAHIVSATNLWVVVNPVTKTGYVSAILNLTRTRTVMFALKGIVITKVAIGTHVWTRAVAKVYIANATVSGGLTAGLGLTVPLFPLNVQIATATAYLY
jgi:hypothetical protein